MINYYYVLILVTQIKAIRPNLGIYVKHVNERLTGVPFMVMFILLK